MSNSSNSTLDDLTHPQPATTATAADAPAPEPAPAPARSFAPPASAAAAAGGFGGGAIARIALFAMIVLVPVAALGYVYWDFQRSGGIKELADGTKLVDLKAMSTFSFDQENGTVEDVPEKFRALDGEKVLLEGEMVSTTSAAGRVAEFDLVYSISDCCYSGAPQVQHFIKSTLAEGGTVPFYRGTPVQVRGTLRVDVQKSDGKVQSVYQLSVDDVQPIG